jgi:hypothetical protein
VFSRIECRGGYLGVKGRDNGEWRRLHNKELYALYFSANIIRVVKSRRLKMGMACSTYGREELHTGF